MNTAVFKIYLKTVGLNIIITLAIGIGMMLFIIPGVLVALLFSQSYYILSQNTNKSIIQCLDKSAKMMDGHKMELFYLEL